MTDYASPAPAGAPTRPTIWDGKRQREIWRPSDGNGDADPLKIEKNMVKSGPGGHPTWKIFIGGVNTPFIEDKNEPPAFVYLDDRGCYDVLASHLYAGTRMGKLWPYDFTAHGQVRKERQNRGRTAYLDNGNTLATWGQGANNIYTFKGGPLQAPSSESKTGSRPPKSSLSTPTPGAPGAASPPAGFAIDNNGDGDDYDDTDMGDVSQATDNNFTFHLTQPLTNKRLASPTSTNNAAKRARSSNDAKLEMSLAAAAAPNAPALQAELGSTWAKLTAVREKLIAASREAADYKAAVQGSAREHKQLKTELEVERKRVRAGEAARIMWETEGEALRRRIALQDQEIRLLQSGPAGSPNPGFAEATNIPDRDEILGSIAAVREANEREVALLKETATKQQAEKNIVEKRLAEHIEALAQMKRKLMDLAGDAAEEMVKVKAMCVGSAQGVGRVGVGAEKGGLGAETGEGEGRDGQGEMMVE